MPIKRHSYYYKLRVQVLDALRSERQHAVSRRFGISRRNLRNSMRGEGGIRAFRGPRRQRSRTAGRVETVLFADHLLTFTKDTRRAEKENQEALLRTRGEFSASFWSHYCSYNPSEIVSIDETGVYYGMPPSKTLALRGGSSKVAKLPSHSARMTAVLGIRADGHFYTTQANAWMDFRVWAEYLRVVVAPEIEGPSVLMVDNLDAHVSTEAVSIIASQLHSGLQPLPPNSTSACQPLDVGVMGPLKKRLRPEWLIKEHMAGATAKEKRIAMIERTIKVWKSLADETIRSSFSKALTVQVPRF